MENEVKQEKRLTLDLSNLASGQKDILKESEELIRTKSAPVVHLKSEVGDKRAWHMVNGV